MKSPSIFIVIFLLLNSNAFGANSDMSSSCAPNGVTAFLKEKINPKNFWAHQATEAESALENWRTGYQGEGTSPMTIEDCRIDSRGDRIKFQECVTYIQSEIGFWTRCGHHARKMCRLYGGYC